jgi:hypothetical protein
MTRCLPGVELLMILYIDDPSTLSAHMTVLTFHHAMKL